MIKRILGVILLCLCLPFLCYADGWFFAGGSACDPNTDYVGYTGAGDSTYSWSENTIVCQLYTPTCSGNLGTAWIKAVDAAEQESVGVFPDTDTDSVADDAQLGNWAEITNSGSAFTESPTKITGAVTTGVNCWVCYVSESTSTQIYRITSGGPIYWGSCAYGSLPSTLSGISFTSVADRTYSVYVEIE